MDIEAFALVSGMVRCFNVFAAAPRAFLGNVRSWLRVKHTHSLDTCPARSNKEFDV